MDEQCQATVLVVDDEPCIRDLVVRWLRGAGYTCHQAGSAEEAWQVLGRSAIPLVTLDITLPGRSGIEFLEQVKAEFQDTEVIMLTALGQTDIAISALTKGAAAYLIKPVEKDELLFQARRALERRQLLLEKRHYTEQLEARVREQTSIIRRAHEETIHRLVTASMYRDEETGAHIRRVGMYSSLMAEAMGWSRDDVERIRMAAPMHDIGKIGIPDAVLQKPGKLTPDEYEAMKRHTIIGAGMLAGSESPVLQLARTIALSHHERWDGKGYPGGLAGEQIPECARIVAVADVYDALTHDRVYRSALSENEAIRILENGRGIHFDPHLLCLFLSLLPEMRRIAHEAPDDVPRYKSRTGQPLRLALDVTASELMLQQQPDGPIASASIAAEERPGRNHLLFDEHPSHL
jgi:putative two-component system response regulator